MLEFLNYQRSEDVPRRIAGDERKLFDKTVFNFHVNLVEPLKREEIELLLKACDACVEAETHDTRSQYPGNT